MLRGIGIHQSEDKHQRRRHEEPRHPIHDQGIQLAVETRLTRVIQTRFLLLNETYAVINLRSRYFRISEYLNLGKFEFRIHLVDCCKELC